MPHRAFAMGCAGANAIMVFRAEAVEVGGEGEVVGADEELKWSVVLLMVQGRLGGWH